MPPTTVVRAAAATTRPSCRPSAASPPSGRSASRSPGGHELNIREVRLAAGAEFIVMVCGDVMTMPGLPKHSTANVIDVDDKGRIQGLF